MPDFLPPPDPCRMAEAAVTGLDHGSAWTTVTAACVHEHVTTALPACRGCLDRARAEGLCCRACELDARPGARHCCPLEVRAFPRCLVVKAEDGRDLYVGWSENSEAPVCTGTRAEFLAEGCEPSRLERADLTGTSSVPGFYDWAADGMVAEQRGHLPRARLAQYAALYLDGRQDEAFDLLEPFEGETEVRRD